MSLRDRLVGIVDYQAGNTHSIQSAFEHLGARTKNVRAADDLEQVTHILLPGVGAFGHCAERLRATGMIPAIERAVFDDGKPLLGICVGMQLLADRGEEMGGHEGLGWIGGTVRAMRPQAPTIRVPHVGWNDVKFEEAFGDFAVGESADFYFDHSFAYHDPVRGRTIGRCKHGETFTAVVRSGNIVAAQFHPEKSQAVGLKFLTSFTKMESAC
jgi:imidazole glycerol-phosphate synthase subunit HisH